MDYYRYTGNKQALYVTNSVVDKWLLPYVTRIVQTDGRDSFQRMLKIEFGAMQETLYHLFETSGDIRHAWCATFIMAIASLNWNDILLSLPPSWKASPKAVQL